MNTPTTSDESRNLQSWMLAILAVVASASASPAQEPNKRLADAIIAAAKDTPAWRLDALLAARETVPDAENSAIVIAKVAAMLPDAWPSPPTTAGTPDPPPGPVQVAYERLTATASNRRLDSEAAATLREELAKRKEAVRLARTVAGYRRGRHEIQVPANPLNLVLRETVQSRNVARLLQADALVRAEAGDVDGALDSCRAILGVARSIGDEPTIISTLVRIAIGAVAVRTAQSALGQGEPSDPALAGLQSDLLDEAAQPNLVRALRGERAALDEVILRIAEGTLTLSDLLDEPGGGRKNNPLTEMRFTRAMYDRQRALTLEWMNEEVAIARRPSFEHAPRFRALQAERGRVKENRPLQETMLPLLLTPASGAAYPAATRAQAELGATTIVIAAERHRRKTGSWPESIAAIDPAILRTPPADPYSGSPFLLERTDGRFLVHSVGANLKDERGSYDLKRLFNGGPDDVNAAAWDVALRRRPVASRRVEPERK